MAPIYLDHHASTPLLPVAAEAMARAAADGFANPASSHAAGRRARQLLEDARDTVARCLGGHADEVLFTSGATEANNLAVFGLLPTGGAAISSAIEHPCVTEPLKQLAARGHRVDWLPVDGVGRVAVNDVTARLRPDTRLVSLMLVNHEVGTVQPVREVAAALPASVTLHTDAAQAVGKMRVHFHELKATALTASAHKFGGPKGVGVLLLKRGAALQPLTFGGHQQRGKRPGTESPMLAAALAAALDHATANLAQHVAHLRRLQAVFLDTLASNGVPFVRNGDPDGVPSVVNLSFPGRRADVLLMALDLAGVACSAGSACSSGSLLPSPVLEAMGVPDEVLRSAVRFSFGPTLSEAAVADAAGRLVTILNR